MVSLYIWIASGVGQFNFNVRIKIIKLCNAVCLFWVEADSLSKSEESQYTINFQCKYICIASVWTLEGLVLPHPSCMNPLLFSLEGGGRAGSSHGGISYSGTFSLLPVGRHWIPFVVAIVRDSQQQALICSWLEFDHDNLGNCCPEKSAAIADTSWWMTTWRTCLELWTGQTRFTALQSKYF